MANVHVLEAQGSGYRVAFHIAIPSANNSAGLNWRAVLITSGLGGRTVLADGAGSGTDGGIATAEKTSLTSGAVYEHVEVVQPPPGLNTAQLNAWLDDLFAARTAEVQAALQTRLAQYGRVH